MKKTLYNMSVVVEHDADGYIATCPALSGCYAQGDTYEEVMEHIRDAIALHVEDRREAKEEVKAQGDVSVSLVEVAV